MQGKRDGFTLIELLVVVSIIALLIALLLPALGMAKESANKAVCMSQQRQIVTAIFFSIEDHDGVMYPAPNNGWWAMRGGTRRGGAFVKDLGPDDPRAYWGVRYKEYIQDAREVFHCPSALGMDAESNFPGLEGAPTSTYGLNGFVSGRPLENFVRPGSTIVFHDAFEHKLDNNGDMLHIREGDSINLPQWRFHPQFSETSVREYFRHLASSNIMWYDGHVSELKETTGENAFEEWYTGEKILPKARRSGRGSRRG